MLAKVGKKLRIHSFTSDQRGGTMMIAGFAIPIMLIAAGVWDVKRMANIEELPPRPFLGLLNRIGLPARIRDERGDRAVAFLRPPPAHAMAATDHIICNNAEGV